MKTEPAEGKDGYKAFKKVCSDVYRGNKYYRGTEASIEKMLVAGKSAYHSHAVVKPFVISDGNDTVGRFALIHDKLLPDYVQVSFFEALPGLGDIYALISQDARKHFPECSKIVVGLNGHLNYGAGMLLSRFDEPPVFGLPYTPEYYAGYFTGLTQKRLVSYRFLLEGYLKWAKNYRLPKDMKDFNIRCMNKKRIAEECKIYTMLNNRAFLQHPYWANRSEAEDLELFYPFRFLLKDENLIIAEFKGKPVGFFLWYPDFNQLIGSQRDLNVFDVIHYRIKHSIDTFRFTEVGILPDFQCSPVGLAMFSKALPYLENAGFTYCEGGFIFEENRSSIALAIRMIQRAFGVQPEPYRYYAVYDGKL